ncbi:Predicted amino acid racemase [Chitinophaga eiseniae]|uniref:Predicted amino acid racemase n=1 Tax=Chitinophaga eiseniae TaxID=634771 RepID=A0A1T4SXN6_9BACT|nr:alanine racemase [Chitinophaga eiseniae]SKA32688.1 Predicted amino acid racemase [Chitinophaga eiseniae]
MAFITLNQHKLRENFNHLNDLFSSYNIEWSIVAKVFCGNKKYLNELIQLGIRQICDSRIDNLETIKSIKPDIETVFIKPPAKRNVARIVKFADISFNTEYETIKMLSVEAVKQDKIHKIVIMLELGELREGVMREQFVDFYAKVFRLPNIKVVGIGTNLTCMYGVLPNHDKLIQLCLYKQLIEAKFNKVIPYISGGASVTVPLIYKDLLPAGINHFRIGETLFLGTDVYHSRSFEHMHNDVFKLYAEIIELNEKPAIPSGELGQNLAGQTMSFQDTLQGTLSCRAIVDIGLLDVEDGHIRPVNRDMQIVGASSDMIVVDLGPNITGLKVGSLIEFEMDYMGLLRIMNSAYVDKRIDEGTFFYPGEAFEASTLLSVN